MSDEDQPEEVEAVAEEEQEVEAEEVEPVHEPEKPKYHPRPQEEPEEKELTEAEQKMLEHKKKKEEDDAQKMAEFEEKRRIEREREEEELRALKEKQEQRKREREVEEREFAERKKQLEEQRLADEAAKKQKAEEEKQKKEEEKKKKLQMMAGIMQGEGGRNFTINKNEGQADKFEKFGNIVKAKSEMALTDDQKKAMKSKALQDTLKPLDLSGLDINGLRAKVKELHDRICKLEGTNYDLEKRTERQAYDVKELTERQRQINRNKALKKGLDPDQASEKHPPKVPTASKYDRQVDRRSYGDRKDLFENPRKPAAPKIFHGSARPPSEWGKKENEELEMIRRSIEGPRYQEVVKIEGARPPMDIVPVQMPAEDEGDEEEE